MPSMVIDQDLINMELVIEQRIKIYVVSNGDQISGNLYKGQCI